MSEPLSIKDMPYITTEQVARYRSASLAIEQQRDELLEALKDATPQPQEDKVRELEKDAARYRWLRDHYPGFASYRSGVIPYVNLDSEVDKQIAYRKRSHE